MRPSDLFTRSADALGRRPWLAPLALLGLNLGYLAWSQDAVSGLGIGNVSAQQRSDVDPLEQGIRLLSVQEALQVQRRVQFDAHQAQARAQAQAAALANEPEKVGDTVQESEIVLEYEPPSKPSAATRPASKNKAPQPIVELRVKNPRY